MASNCLEKGRLSLLFLLLFLLGVTEPKADA